jgi:hypothetical protein
MSIFSLATSDRTNVFVSFSAKGATFIGSLGQRPRTKCDHKKEAPALKARLNPVGDFSIPNWPWRAVRTDYVKTERALNLASRIEHAPSPQSSPRKRGEAGEGPLCPVARNCE